MLRRTTATSFGFVMAALLLLASVAELRSQREARQALQQAWAEAGATIRPAPQALEVAKRDPDPAAARLAMARAALAESLDARWLSELPPEDAAREAARLESRLELARAEAEAVYVRRPAAWEAPLVLGGAAYVEHWRQGDLHRRRQEWEPALLRARSLAPHHREPTELLVGSRLALWHTLHEEEREATRGMLQVAFEEVAALQRLLPAWVAVVSGPAELFSVLPETPLPWQLLEEQWARQRQWELACVARDRWRPLRLAELAAELAEAESRLDAGDLAGGRRLLLGVASSAPPSRQAAPILSRALERLPPGPVGPRHDQAFRGWLEWGLALWAAEQPSLPPETFRRLSGVVSGLPPHQVALAALAGEELARAELLERRVERAWSAEWAPYLIAKARILSSRGDVEGAAAALAQVHRNARDSRAYRALAAGVGTGESAAAAAGSAGRERAGKIEATSWHGLQWERQGGRHFLDIVPGHAADGLAIHLYEMPRHGGAVELSWNGVVLGCFPVVEEAPLHVDLALDGEPGLLELRLVGSGRVVPGSVELVGRRSG
jgi:hypothetical protein